MAFYWHPCGNSASPLSRRVPISRINRSSRATYPRNNRTFGRPMRIALYEPDIPQNTGTILRLCACLGLEAHIIEPAGFPVTDRAFRRAGMDYLDRVAITRHGSFAAFEDWRRAERLKLVLLTHRRRDLLSRPRLCGTTRCCCSAAKAPACRRPCMPPPTSACASRCRGPALAQRGDGGGDGCRRSAAADGGPAELAKLDIR